MKLVYTLFLLFFMSSIPKSKDIVSNVNVVFFETIDLGEEIEISFDINFIREDDSYNIEVEVDYNHKVIEIKIDYDLDEDSDFSTDEESETVEVQMLLEGSYDIVVEVDVSFDSGFDQTIDGPTIDVVNPENKHCDESFIPLAFGWCPSVDNPVCACNGQNYENECEAYLVAKNGKYYEFECGEYVATNSVEFECGKAYTPDLENIFESYSCSGSINSADEIYIEYSHENDSMQLNYTTSPGTNVYLINSRSDGLDCVAEGYNNTLNLKYIPKGLYYIVVDSDIGWSSITFCDSTTSAISESIYKIDLEILPNPSTTNFMIKASEDYGIELNIFDTNGKSLYHNKEDITNTLICHHLPSGLYFVLMTIGETLVVQKLIVE